MKILKNKEYWSALLVVAFYLGLAFTWAINSKVPLDGEAALRVSNCMNVFDNPAELVSLWNSPLFVLLFSIPSLISLHAVQWIMPLILASGACALFLGFHRKDYKGALLIIPFFLFQSYSFFLSHQAYPEPLAASIIAWCIYAFLQRRWILLGVLTGLLPMTCFELSPVLLLPLFLFIYKGQWKGLFLLFLPTLIWAILGSIVHEDVLFWMNEPVFEISNGKELLQTKWYVHLYRHLVVCGPVVFVPFLSGLFLALLQKKHRLFGILFLLGFLFYSVLDGMMEWISDVSYFRKITVLSPFIALFSSIGVMNIWDVMNGKRRIPLPIFQSKQALRKKQAEKEDAQLYKWQKTILIGLACISGALTTTRLAHEMMADTESDIHVLIPFFGLAALFVLFGVAFVIRKSKKQIPYTYLIAFSALALAFITASELSHINTSEDAVQEEIQWIGPQTE